MKIYEGKKHMLADGGHASLPPSLCALLFTWTAASTSCLPPAALIVSIHGQQMDAASQPVTLSCCSPRQPIGLLACLQCAV